MSRKFNSALRTAALVAALGAVGSSYAFVPSVGLGAITPGESHAAITKTGLTTIYGELGITSVSRTMEQARDTMLEANAQVDKTFETSTAHHCDAENINRCNEVVVAAFDSAVRSVQANNLDDARKNFGAALHTLQDFYSHSNWIELGNNSLHPQMGRPGRVTGISPSTFNGDTTNAPTCIESPTGACMRNNLITPLLTSGYYGGQNRDRPPGKCRHGGFFDKSPGVGGINKDMAACLGTTGNGLFDSPHSDRHPEAAALAAQATADLLRQMKAKVTLRQFKSFLGIGAPFAFAIDTTGSMGSVIEGVKSQVNVIIDSRANTPEEASQYVLAPFNDPGVPTAIVTENPAAFKSALAGLFASGGGDCPELSMAGAYNAVAAADKGAQVYLFTDASAKDFSTYGSVLDLASTKKSRLFFALFGNCSPYDPVYFALARNTGGQVFILNRPEAAQVSRLADAFSRTDTVDILTISGTLTPTPRTYQFPVDSHISRMNLSVARTAPGTVVVRRPDGSTLTPTTPGATEIPLSNTTAYAITTPQRGVWSITVSGSDTFSILVNGESDFAFSQFQFVEPGGRPGHSGAFPLTGSPAPGKQVYALANVGRFAVTKSYEFRSPEGSVLARFDLSNNDAADPTSETGQVTIPTGPFKVYALGQDNNRNAYQRVVGNVVNPQTVSVSAPTAVGLPQGQVTTYIFSVRNDGPAATFRFSAIDDKRFVSGLAPQTATIPTGGSALVTVRMTPPAGTPVGTVSTLTFSAEDASNPDARNYASLSSSVIAPPLVGDVNRDGRVDCDDLGIVRASFGSRPGSGKFNPNVDLDVNGVIDVRDLAIITRLIPAGTVCK
ncbi:hypothetical protein G4G28_08640 [Massilia sp. Dwa41.01b]|uniref:dockerin type I domain-containing protein n=1 Tax=unclassified Massilia TaxID=2609279 RepID=UPI0016026E85|nr:MULTISPECIES: dockerin type I domain-containing protein [unclassified Massilia]QNA88539.1 hypothetical protein G4G28_08640 [Massilia sp. Dwa41.01b]QNA99438.1 hypothetical protein G4G31_12305 [Massilia sp. Se16.2.3]